MFLVLKWPKKLLQERYPNIEHVDSLSFVIGILAVFLEKLGYSIESLDRYEKYSLHQVVILISLLALITSCLVMRLSKQ